MQSRRSLTSHLVNQKITLIFPRSIHIHSHRIVIAYFPFVYIDAVPVKLNEIQEIEKLLLQTKKNNEIPQFLDLFDSTCWRRSLNFLL